MKTSKTMLISSLFAIIVLSSVTILLENAWGHGVQAQLQSRFIRVTDETFSTQTLETGEENIELDQSFKN